uniref:rRNA methyltransferase 2, mitochondrial n=2 Tax=Clastoptera arizonana TaxID=38151 RepID=A0A1B6CF18_9HEMI
MQLRSLPVLILSAINFSTSEVMCKINPKNAKGGSSNNWLRRHLNDPYVELAKNKNYRCRSAFKLLEIDSKLKLFQPGQCVVDCGAAPGSWSQVAVSKTNANGKNENLPKGKVISIDKLQIHPIEGAIILGNLDFTAPEAMVKLTEALDNKQTDIVLSDMAPNSSGIKSMDHDRIMALAFDALRFALQVTKIGGSLVIKIWDGSDTQELFKNMQKHYKIVRRFKPKASHQDSSELFLVAKEFKGP